MKFLKSLLSAILATAISLTAHSEEASPAEAVQIDGAKIGHWTMDFDAAKKIAAEKKLPLLLNFTGSDWCGWCKLMDSGVFEQEAWKAFASENALLVTIDFPKDKSIVPEKFVERNQDLQAQFGVRGYPTYVILDSDGETKLGQLGAGRDKTPESFIAEFKAVTRLSPSSIEAFVKANPEKAEAYKAAIQNVENAKKTLMDWIETQPERNDENEKKFSQLQEAIQAAEDALAEF